jgi:hypothetical protein
MTLLSIKMLFSDAVQIQNRTLIFGTVLGEITGDWRRLRNQELRNLCSSLNIVMFIKARRM